MQVQEKLQGDLIALGYFYAELMVGTPPQTFSLIVDTGSSVTAIPCTGCHDCGPHTNPRFKPESSSTFRRAPCVGSLYCTSCVRGVCGYRVSYQEGSSYSGFIARDVVRLGVRGACVAVESFPFGCSTEETGLFTSQQADGIMGLGTSRRHADQSNPTVLEALVEQRLVEDVFSLCIGALRGTLTFGMPQLAPPLGARAGEPREPASLFWTRVVESTYYGVEVTAIMLGEQVPRPTSLPSPAATLCTQAATLCTEAATLCTQAATLCTQAATMCTQAATPCTQAATLCTKAATMCNQAATLCTQAATLCTQAATLCTQAATLCTQALGPASLPSSSIVDSGTTFMYLHSPVR